MGEDGEVSETSGFPFFWIFVLAFGVYSNILPAGLIIGLALGGPQPPFQGYNVGSQMPMAGAMPTNQMPMAGTMPSNQMGGAVPMQAPVQSMQPPLSSDATGTNVPDSSEAYTNQFSQPPTE